MMTMAWATMSAHAITVTDTLFNRSQHEDFAFGADVSFVPQMESWGTKWLDKNGRQKDILQILKEQGINSIRLRVWTVNSGASSKQEVVSLCKRAKAKGMSVMIDFHYSDTWADPGSQTIPAAWKDHSVEALAKNVYDHTYDVLSAIKAAGVVPKWVQVGNGAKWDIIGLSAYPRWSHLDGPTMITRVMSNINDLKKRYGKPCMVVETGHYPREAVVGNQYLVGVMDRMIKNGDLGCFYWEPESMGGYDMGAWDEATRKPTVMMDAFLGVKHTEVSWLMKAQMTTPTQEQDIADGLTLKADVKHVRNRAQKVDFYLDKQLAGTVTESPYELPVESVEPGQHIAWVKVTDSDKNTQLSDTVTFFTGESAQMDDPIVTDGTQKGGTARWGMTVKAPGKYRLLFKYTAPNLCGAEARISGDSIGRLYFMKSADTYLKRDIEISESGNTELSLTATSSYGLPDIAWLRIYPLEQQPIPSLANLTGISSLQTSDDETVEVYSLSGKLLWRLPASQLGFSLGDRTSAVVVLPNCVGGTPYIVRKQRLK